MNRYRKLLVAIIGLIALEFGPEYVPAPEVLTEVILSICTALGVWVVPNAKDTEPERVAYR